ncbi:hypothetical protein V498_08621, partial [Pseudogymnoascus sp. VKM F-4517 (FW-2822)]
MIDATFKDPTTDEFFAFSGSQFVRFAFADSRRGDKITNSGPSGDDLEDELIFGPHKILNTWKCLAQAGFDTVNAVMPVPDTEAEAYFFQGI